MKKIMVCVILFILSFNLLAISAKSPTDNTIPTEITTETILSTEEVTDPTIMETEPEATMPPSESEEDVEPLPPTPEPPEEEEDDSCINWYSDYRVYPTNKVTTTAGGYPFTREFLAKMINREAWGMNWEGKVYTCSAILNFCDRYKISLWKAGHSKNCFAVAPYVDKATPTEEDYAVVDYVLNGGRIGEICHFRTKYYHNTFPNIPICEVDGHYFSIREKRAE